MTSIGALFAATLLAGPSAPSAGAASGATGDVSFDADQVIWHGENGTYDLSGGVVVRRGTVVLRARSATLDPETGEVQANGDVLLLDATRAIRADGVHAFLDGPFEATNVIAFKKEKPLDPTRIGSFAEARRGRNLLTFSADRVEGEDEDHYTLYGVRFTLCDCGEGHAPTWELGSPRARVDGERMALSWPVLRLAPFGHQVPVLILPWLSLPLTDRQTGFLFPEVSSRPAITGWSLGFPLYVTLGRSADMTVTPEYFFGPANGHNPGGAVQGPGARLELRWAPAPRAEGGVLFHLVDDLDREKLQSTELGGHGLRLSIEGGHIQDLGPDTRLVAHLSLSQDSLMFRDFHGIGLPGDAYYSRSDVQVSYRKDPWVLEGGTTYLEPLVPADQARPGPQSWFGLGLPAAQRWPSVGAALVPVWAGPLELDGRAGISRYAPYVGAEGELLPTDPGYCRADTKHLNPSNQTISCPGLTQEVALGQVPLPRPAVTRGEARLQLSAPFLVGDTVSLEPFLRGAVNGYLFDERSSSATLWGLAGLSASSEFFRRFGTVEHRIIPRLEFLGGPAPWRANPGDPFPAYDLWDRIEADRTVPVEVTPGQGSVPVSVVQKLSAAPDSAYAQVRATVESRMNASGGAQFVLALGQDLDARTGQLAETSASLHAAKGPVSADASMGFLAFGGRPPLAQGWARSWLDEFTQLHLGVNVHDQRGDAIRASLDSAGSGAVGAQAAGVDALFDLHSTGTPPDAWYNVGAKVPIATAVLDYSARLAARQYPSVQCANSGATRSVDPGHIYLQTATFTWDSPCHCLNAFVSASRDVCDDLSFNFGVDLSKIFQGAARKGG